jgi:hypothetical protein
MKQKIALKDKKKLPQTNGNLNIIGSPDENK